MRRAVCPDATGELLAEAILTPRGDDFQLGSGTYDFQAGRICCVSDQRIGEHVAVTVERARYGNTDMLKAAPSLVLHGGVETRRDDFHNRVHAAISVLSGT